MNKWKRKDMLFLDVVVVNGGDYDTEYLSYSCVDCPYFTNAIDGKGRG